MANQEKLAMEALEEVSGGVSREAVINAVSKGWKVSKQFVSDNYGKILTVLGLMAVSYEFKSMFKTTTERGGGGNPGLGDPVADRIAELVEMVRRRELPPSLWQQISGPPEEQ